MMTKLNIAIVPAEPSHVERFHVTLDTVAREGLWLGSTEAKPIESLGAFVLSSIEKRNPIFFAMDGEQLVGWCDITRSGNKTTTHCGELGMGVLANYRGKGIGTRLIEAALNAASEVDIPRVELTVYATNPAAIGLYRKVGFVEEGRMSRFAVLKGAFVDAIAMARVDEAGMGRFLADGHMS
jgi:RimJ/RimL family protein N-acetyltransferase